MSWPSFSVELKLLGRASLRMALWRDLADITFEDIAKIFLDFLE